MPTSAGGADSIAVRNASGTFALQGTRFGQGTSLGQAHLRNKLLPETGGGTAMRGVAMRRPEPWAGEGLVHYLGRILKAARRADTGCACRHNLRNALSMRAPPKETAVLMPNGRRVQTSRSIRTVKRGYK
jgi:hypothetical protein